MLAEILSLNIFHAALVFVRMGTVFMFVPGFSASYVGARVRLLLAMAVTFVLTPTLQNVLPAMPESPSLIVLLIIMEVFYGVFLGMIGQAILGAINLAGNSIGQNSGLMNAMVFDPVTEQQGAIVVGLLSNVALVSIFVLDLHHLILEAAVGTYELFPPGTPPMPVDHLAHYLDVLQSSFVIGLQLSAPFVVVNIVFQTAMGLVSRLSPQMNVFFVGLPLQILIGLGMLWVGLPAMMMWFLGYFEDTLMPFRGG